MFKYKNKKFSRKKSISFGLQPVSRSWGHPGGNGQPYSVCVCVSGTATAVNQSHQSVCGGGGGGQVENRIRLIEFCDFE